MTLAVTALHAALKTKHIVKDNYYFDNAATTWPKPEPVYAFMDSFFRSHGVNPGRSGHTLAIEAEQMIVSTRKMLAQFFAFDGDPNRVVFTQNATDSLNMALNGLLQRGDHVIISQLDHNAVLRPINHLQRDGGVDATFLKPDAQGLLDLNVLETSITKKTKAVVINHASNVIGVVQDLKAIASITKKHGVTLIVDSAQTAGVLNIDMSWGIDVLTFTGHKGLFGPMGIGGLVVAEGVELSSTRFGGTGVDSISAFQPESYPHRLEAGTVSIPGIAGLHAAQKWFAEKGLLVTSRELDKKDHAICCKAAVEHIHQTEMGHANRIWDHLQQIEKVRLMGERVEGRDYVATLSFSVDDIPATQMAEMLDADYHICVRAGLHCAPEIHNAFGTVADGGAIRIAPGYFTETQDVDHLLDALTQLLQP